MRRALVSVMGGAQVSEEVKQQAEELGHALARRGLSVLCGGRSGVMEAVCKGVQDERAQAQAHELATKVVTIGLLPDKDTSLVNPYVDFAIPSGMGFSRNSVIAMGGEVAIAVSGSSGTLSEIALAWQFGKPVAAMASSGGWSAELAGRALDAKRAGEIFAAKDAEAAADWAASEIARLRGE